ncbi:MAG TPA: hypothetical protein VFV31_09505 [Chitinophagaceae bacterium]|nr:hypothetical protein [Chitinophagaceae bacterium]
MRIASHLLFALIFLCSWAHAQQPKELGAEYIRSSGKGFTTAKVAARGETFNSRNSFSIGITYQLGSAKSYSVSRGFGLYVGYRYAFGKDSTGSKPFAGARILFSLENFEGQTNRNSLFITPWAEAGYHLLIARRFFAAPSAGFGYTFKFSKDYHSLDEDIGQRFIPSISAGYRF